MDSHSFPQGIFLTQRWNLGLQNCRQILYCLSDQGSLQYINKLKVNSMEIKSRKLLLWFSLLPFRVYNLAPNGLKHPSSWEKLWISFNQIAEEECYN